MAKDTLSHLTVKAITEHNERLKLYKISILRGGVVDRLVELGIKPPPFSVVGAFISCVLDESTAIAKRMERIDTNVDA